MSVFSEFPGWCGVGVGPEADAGSTGFAFCFCVGFVFGVSFEVPGQACFDERKVLPALRRDSFYINFTYTAAVTVSVGLEEGDVFSKTKVAGELACPSAKGLGTLRAIDVGEADGEGRFGTVIHDLDPDLHRESPSLMPVTRADGRVGSGCRQAAAVSRRSRKRAR